MNFWKKLLIKKIIHFKHSFNSYVRDISTSKNNIENIIDVLKNSLLL